MLIGVTAEPAFIQLDINAASDSTLTDELDPSPRILVVHPRNATYLDELVFKKRKPKDTLELEWKSPLVDAVWHLDASGDGHPAV